MTKRISRTLFLFLLLFGRLLIAAVESKSQLSLTPHNVSTVIRVLIGKDLSNVQLQTLGQGTLEIRPAGAQYWLPTGKSLKLQVSDKGSGILGLPWGLSRIYDVDVRPQGVGVIRYQAALFRGTLHAKVFRNRLWIVNQVPLETYLEGTLAAEMNSNWEDQALRAQAVASRTYATYMIAHPKSKFFDLEHSVQDQVYEGIGIESPRIHQAVLSTSGEILLSEGNVFKAFYHSRCGGQTEKASTVWQSNDESRRVHCEYCSLHPYIWRAEIKIQSLLKALNLPLSKQLGSMTAERSPTGRVSWLTLVSRGISKRISSDQFRQALGYQKIRSAFFNWTIHDNEMTFQGVGSGHGVGMCQWGARQLARDGKNYQEILAHYYPGTELRLALNDANR
jgi:stage II sporulation protein D